MADILLTGGGTAGHVTPNIALVPLLRQQGYGVHYAGTADGIERRLIAQAFPDMPYHVVSAGKLRRYRDIKNLTDPFRTIAGVAQSARICQKHRFAAVFSKGGFVSLPVVVGGRLAGVPTILHESDMTPGLANRLALPFARRVCTTFEKTAAAIGKKAVFTGTPIRPELFAGDAQKARRALGFAADRPVLLVTGGSQGAQAINTAVRQALPQLLGRFYIIHLCGRGNLDQTLQAQPGLAQIEYADAEMADYLALADVVLSRAGSNTLCELIALCKPHLLVPLPLSASRGDQIDNADAMSRRGYSTVLPQEQMTAQTLYDALCALYQNRQAYISAMQAADFAAGAQRVAQAIVQAARA